MNRVTLRQLEAFYWTATLGAVHRAARHLNLAQPTVSLRLRDLQAGTGYTLLERHGTGVRLTPDGRNLLGRVQLVLEGVHRIGNMEEGAEIRGPLRIGLPESFASLYLPTLIDALRKSMPAVHPEWVISQSVELERDVVAQNLDLAVIVNPIDDAGVRLVPLGFQGANWVAGPKWELSGAVRPADLWQLPIMTNPPPSNMHRKIRDWFASGDMEPACLDTCTSVTTIMQLVASGVALSILPTKLVSPAVAAGAVTIVPTAPAVEPDTLYAGYLGSLQTRAVEITVRILRKLVASIPRSDGL